MEWAQKALLLWVAFEVLAHLVLAVAQGNGWQPKPRGKPNYAVGLLWFAGVAVIAYLFYIATAEALLTVGYPSPKWVRLSE